jgi:hypothetical protein
VVDSLKVLDPNRPIREADIGRRRRDMAMTRMTHLGHGGPGERILQAGHGYEF